MSRLLDITSLGGLDLPQQLPRPADRRIAVRVTAAAERAIRGGHPWLYDQAIRSQSHDGAPGDLAVVFDRRRRFVAIGLYDPLSPIRVRILQRGQPAAIDADWFRAKVDAAVRIRAALPAGTTGYRLVHGENDGFPGLVIDRYDQTLALKLYTAAWLPHLRQVPPALMDVFPPERIVLRLGRAVVQEPSHLYGLENGAILSGPGLSGPVLFRENGLCFEADPVHGQKTGFFLDQRDNRSRVEKLAAGRTVLDVFAYTGAFSVYAARGGAHAITSVEGSHPASEVAARNFALNGDHPSVAAAEHELLVEDAFQALERLGRSGHRFDLVNLDPPAFGKNQAEVARALSSYEQLTRLGLGVLAPGGVFVLSSCSSRVTAEMFCAAVHRAAQEVGRPLQEIELSGHPLDHPVGFKEGAYLKCLIASGPAVNPASSPPRCPGFSA